MNPNARSLARNTFLRALQQGPLREPVAVAAVFAKLQAQGEDSLVDVKGLEEALDAEFPWRNHLVFHSGQPQPDELEAWEQAVRWVTQSMLALDSSAEGGSRRFQVLLIALGTLDVGWEGLSAVSDQFAGTQVPTSCIELLQRLGYVPGDLDARSKAWLHALRGQVMEGNLKMLQQAQGRVDLNVQSDVSTAILLLWKLQPEELVRVIDMRDSVLLALAICIVLDENAPLLALKVQSVTFKFISTSWLERMEHASKDVSALGVLQQLLLQVAQTPLWKGWLQANYEHPQLSEQSSALAEVLTQLGEPQWRDFVSAVDLCTSTRSAEAVGYILAHVSNKIDAVKAHPIWAAAFERWDAWDYGKRETNFFLSSAHVCAFDFPVAMYYAQMPETERGKVERELQHAMDNVEQRWFSSDSALCSERNRLASRLRLVHHGSTLAAGGSDALPPSVQPDSEYAEVRYRYHNTAEVMAKGTRQGPMKRGR